MNSSVFKQAGQIAGFIAVPLALILVIGLISARRLEWYLIVGFIALIVAIAFWAVTNPGVWQKPLGRQRVSSTINGVVIVLALLGVIYLVNVLFKNNTNRFDFTASKAFTLSDTSKNVVKGLKEPVTVRIFYDRNSQSVQTQAGETLKQYAAQSDKINIQSINANIEPLTVDQYGVKTVPSIVFEQNSRKEIVTTLDEQGFTRAFLQVQNVVQRRVLILTGHNEFSTTAAQDGNSISGAITALITNNYKVELYNSLTGTSTPLGVTSADAAQPKPVTLDPAVDVLFIVGSRSRYTDQEKATFVNFLKQGGKALIGYDIGISLTSNPTANININDLLTDFGLTFKSGAVVERRTDQIYQNGPLFLVPTVNTSSPITSQLSGSFVVSPLSVAIEKNEKATGEFTNLLSSSSDSYLETDLPGLVANRSEFDPTKDMRGPIVVAASYEVAASLKPGEVGAVVSPAGGLNPTVSGTLPPTTAAVSPGTTPEVAPTIAPTATAVPTTTPATTPGTSGAATEAKTKIVLFGSASTLGDNALQTLRGNYDVLVNSVNYLGGASQVVIPAKLNDTSPFTLNDSQATLTKLFVIVGLPLLILFLGIVTWWRRR